MVKKIISFAKKLRRHSTETEKRLWFHLRTRKFDGLKFRRQAPIGNYIVDFVCHEKCVIIECDGGQHIEQKKQDQKRDEWLKNQGYRVLRFWDNEVLQNTSGVLEMIYQVCQKAPSPQSPPIKGGEKKKEEILKINSKKKLINYSALAILSLFIHLQPASAASPMRIVSLKPTITDTIYALELGNKLVGVTRYCDVSSGKTYPEIVADYTRPYSERIIALSPDIVLGSKENSSRRSIESLEQAGIKVELFSFTTLNETMRSIEDIAKALDEPERGKILVSNMNKKLAALKTRFASAKPLRIVIVWGTRPLVVAGPGTYMDELLGYIGAENAVQKTKVKYPRIGLEELIALDPDVIVDLSMGSEKKESSSNERPWNRVKEISAKVVTMDTGLLRAGPKLTEGLALLAERVHSKQSPSFVRRGKER